MDSAKKLRAELVWRGTHAEPAVLLGEGAMWEPHTKQLVFVDIERPRLFLLDPTSNENACVQTIDLSEHGMIGTVVPMARSESDDSSVLQLLAACETSGVVQLTLTTQPNISLKEVTPLAHPEEKRDSIRYNDGKCDPAGRFWVGSLNRADETRPDGILYCMDGQKCKEVLSKLRISNGLVWTNDKRTMYFIDTPTSRVDAFDYDHDSGEISNRRTAFTIPSDLGFPDGMAIDAEDHLWIAMWGGWSVICFDPQTGEVLAHVDVPCEQVTSCAFGGPDYQDLYITTCSRGKDLTQTPLAGSVFVARGVGVCGCPVNDFVARLG